MDLEYQNTPLVTRFPLANYFINPKLVKELRWMSEAIVIYDGRNYSEGVLYVVNV